MKLCVSAIGPTIKFAGRQSSPKLKPSHQCSLYVLLAAAIRGTSSIAVCPGDFAS